MIGSGIAIKAWNEVLVNMLAFYFGYLSSNPAENLEFLWNDENELKGMGWDHFKAAWNGEK